MSDDLQARFAAVIAPMAISMRAQDIDEPTILLYFRALRDVPIRLLEQAAVEIVATSKFFPKPAEWRAAVDEILDRRDRLKALDKTQQLALPGEVGEYECPQCDNTGFERFEKPCERRQMCPSAAGEAEHTHTWTRHCSNRYCVEARAQKAAAAKRYSRREG